MKTCKECGGKWSRPGLFRCNDPRHAAPDLAQRIVGDLEADLADRHGFSGEWDDTSGQPSSGGGWKRRSHDPDPQNGRRHGD